MSWRVIMPIVPAVALAVVGTAAATATGQMVWAWIGLATLVPAALFVVRRLERVLCLAVSAVESHGQVARLRDAGAERLATAIERLAGTVERQRRDSEEQNRTLTLLLDNLTDGVIAVDQSGLIFTLNRSAGRLLGTEPSRLVGAAVRNVIRHPELHRLLDSVLVGGGVQPASSEVSLHLPQGRRDLLVRAAGLRTPDGQLQAGLIVLRDVTDVRRLEQLRRDFVANVSHELKTPVTSIRGAAETLAGGALTDADAAPRFVDMIERQSARLQQIIEDLLQLARIERIEEASAALAAEEVVLEDAVQRAAETTAEELDRYGRRLHVESAGSLRVRGDAGLLEQAIVNLISNAARYGGSSADIVVRIRAGAPGQVRIEVVDQGPGIAPEHHERLFERFYRVDQSRSREVGGTGLGLAIVKHIAVLHGGRVGVMSEIGRGSTFWIELPALDGGNAVGRSAAEHSAT